MWGKKTSHALRLILSDAPETYENASWKSPCPQIFWWARAGRCEFSKRIQIHVRVRITCSHTCSHASNFSRVFEFTCACALHACMHVHIPFLRYYKNQPRMSASKSMQGVARVSMHGMKLDLFPDVCHCPVLSARARGLFPTCTCVFVRWKQRTE